MKRKKQRTPKPARVFVKNGTYERMQELQFHFPVQFLMLCKLVQVPPKTILHHFMQDLGRDSWQRHPDERMRTCTAEYFTLRGWGQDYYTETDIRQMLAELNAIGSLWPEGSSMKLISSTAAGGISTTSTGSKSGFTKCVGRERTWKSANKTPCLVYS